MQQSDRKHFVLTVSCPEANVDGFGPENINLESPEEGATYQVAVVYHSSPQPVNATVRVYILKELRWEETRTLDQQHDLGVAAEVDWPASIVTPVDAPSRTS